MEIKAESMKLLMIFQKGTIWHVSRIGKFFGISVFYP